MSRNVRKAASNPKAKPKRRRRLSDTTSSSSLDLSDDGGYSGVDDVSDSEDDDEEDVNAAEEEHIIDRVSHVRHVTSSTRPQPEEDDEDNEADDEVAFPDDDDDQDDEDDDQDDSSWKGIGSDADDTVVHQIQPAPTVERHVRFTGVPDSDSDSTTTDLSDRDADFFPDIFVEQTALDPAFRRQIEQDPDEDSSGGSFWDFEETHNLFSSPEKPSHQFVEPNYPDPSTTPTPTPMASHVVSEVSTPVPEDDYQDLDGYETDGDTTEEDEPEPQVRKKQVRRVQPADGSSSSESDTRRPVKIKSAKVSTFVRSRRRGKPRVGLFDLADTDTKPIAVMNPVTRKMMIFTPSRLRQLAAFQDPSSPLNFRKAIANMGLDSYLSSPFRPGLPLSYGETSLEAPVQMDASLLSNSGSMMIGGMFPSHAFGDLLNTQAAGPAEAFFPTASDDLGEYESSSSEGLEFADDDGEKDLKLDDFIDFDSNDSEAEGDEGNHMYGAGNGNEATPTPSRRPSIAPSTMTDFTVDENADHPLLAHFDGNSRIVGAFRRDQVNKQLIFSDKATEESLLFSNPYSIGPIRGVRSDSLSNVTAPLTPARRRKQSFGGANQGLVSSPLDAVSQKRKASSSMTNEANHKRHRSISDVQSLQI